MLSFNLLEIAMTSLSTIIKSKNKFNKQHHTLCGLCSSPLESVTKGIVVGVNIVHAADISLEILKS